MPRLDGGLHEPARARLVDADRLGELPDRRRLRRRLERVEQPEARRLREPRTASASAMRPARGIRFVLVRVVVVPVVVAVRAVPVVRPAALAAALQPAATRVASHRDERRLDGGDRVGCLGVARSWVFAGRDLTAVIHVCHCTYTCHATCNRPESPTARSIGAEELAAPARRQSRRPRRASRHERNHHDLP
ncbi:hypothetical protein GCM10009748_32460 [Agromyces lapidis]